jgi:DNA-directed RNA polymerase subunit RPC12/RpoP
MSAPQQAFPVKRITYLCSMCESSVTITVTVSARSPAARDTQRCARCGARMEVIRIVRAVRLQPPPPPSSAASAPAATPASMPNR